MDKNHKTQAGGGCQDSNNLSSLDPSLWNSPLGRRSFLKKSGKAGAATVLAMNGMMFEVLASESTESGWMIRAVAATTSSPNPEQVSGTPFLDSDGVAHRFIRTQTITSTPAPVGEWGTSATSVIKVDVSVKEQKVVNNAWADITGGLTFSCTYSRSVTATIDDNGNVTTVYNDGKTATHGENGITINLSPSQSGTGAATISGPSGGSPAYNIPSDTMDINAHFQKRQKNNAPTSA